MFYTWVLKRTDGKYVARAGSPHSYTDKLQHAQTYRTREDAEHNRCPKNEVAVTVESELAQ